MITPLLLLARVSADIHFLERRNETCAIKIEPGVIGLDADLARWRDELEQFYDKFVVLNADGTEWWKDRPCLWMSDHLITHFFWSIRLLSWISTVLLEKGAIQWCSLAMIYSQLITRMSHREISREDALILLIKSTNLGSVARGVTPEEMVLQSGSFILVILVSSLSIVDCVLEALPNWSATKCCIVFWWALLITSSPSEQTPSLCKSSNSSAGSAESRWWIQLLFSSTVDQLLISVAHHKPKVWRGICKVIPIEPFGLSRIKQDSERASECVAWFTIFNKD